MFNRSPVSDDVEEWLIREFEWAITVGLLKKDTPVVTPEQNFFRASKGGEMAVATYDQSPKARTQKY